MDIHTGSVTITQDGGLIEFHYTGDAQGGLEFLVATGMTGGRAPADDGTEINMVIDGDIVLLDGVPVPLLSDRVFLFD
jgi:hypothetical protein